MFLKNKIVLFLYFIIAIVTSCSLAKNSGSTNGSMQEINKSEIVFLVLRISKDSISGKNVIEFVSKTKSTGKIKNENNNHINYDNYLTIEIYERNKLINTMVMDHPLFKRVEFSKGDTLSSKNIELTKEEFFIRLQINNNSNTIKIIENLKNNIKNELTVLKL